MFINHSSTAPNVKWLIWTRPRYEGFSLHCVQAKSANSPEMVTFSTQRVQAQHTYHQQNKQLISTEVRTLIAKVPATQLLLMKREESEANYLAINIFSISTRFSFIVIVYMWYFLIKYKWILLRIIISALSSMSKNKVPCKNLCWSQQVVWLRC